MMRGAAAAFFLGGLLLLIVSVPTAASRTQTKQRAELSTESTTALGAAAEAAFQRSKRALESAQEDAEETFRKILAKPSTTVVVSSGHVEKKPVFRKPATTVSADDAFESSDSDVAKSLLQETQKDAFVEASKKDDADQIFEEGKEAVEAPAKVLEAKNVGGPQDDAEKEFEAFVSVKTDVKDTTEDPAADVQALRASFGSSPSSSSSSSSSDDSDSLLQLPRPARSSSDSASSSSSPDPPPFAFPKIPDDDAEDDDQDKEFSKAEKLWKTTADAVPT